MDAEPSADREAVFRSPDPRLAREPALVLAAVGIPAELIRVEGSVWLVVDAGDAQRARLELRAYVDENRNAHLRSEPFEPLSSGLAVGVAWALSLVLARAVFIFDVGGIDWLGAGRVDARAMVEGGQWWRGLTALFLHADALHLASNLVFGTLFAVFLAHSLGSGLTAAVLVLSGGLGNALNALARAPEHLSVGASTAVFGAVGAFVTTEAARRRRTDREFVRRWAPMLLGVLLLGWFGTGGERTDVSAHLFGFLAGAGLAATVASLPRAAERLRGKGLQAAGWLTAAVGVAGAWICAVR